MFRASVPRILATIAVTLALAPAARADVILTFDIAGAIGYSPIPQNYGDRVTSLSQGGFSYGGDGVNFTPNVLVAYGPTATNVQFWPTSYGDLTNVAFTGNLQSVLTIQLTADPGFQVQLHGFDLAGWPFADYTINSVQVLGDSGNTLFAQNNVLVQGDFNGPRRTPFTFPSLQDQSLTIRLDVGNLQPGIQQESVGIDNIRFSQTSSATPEPATLALFGLGSLVVVARAGWRRRQTPAPAPTA